MHLAGGLLASLKDKYPTLVIKITDFLIDETLIGMEVNEIEERQRRITILKFIGELYNFTILD